MHKQNLTTNPDPYEQFNREVFALNDTVDKIIIKPIATVYTKVLPVQIVTAIKNGFNNLSMIPTTINDGLQCNPYQALQDSGRFLINSTIGIAGLIDVASHVGYPEHYTDLGITFAKWGFDTSPYLLIPVWGPSTFVDAAGTVGNYYLSVYPYIKPLGVRYGLVGLNMVSRRAQLLEYKGLIDEMTFDSYILQRDVYLQYRKKLLEDSKKTFDPWAKNTTNVASDASSEDKVVSAKISSKKS